MEAPMWQNVGLELDSAIGPCVPPTIAETLRGTRGEEEEGERRGGKGGGGGEGVS